MWESLETLTSTLYIYMYPYMYTYVHSVYMCVLKWNSFKFCCQPRWSNSNQISPPFETTFFKKGKVYKTTFFKTLDLRQ